MQIHCSTWDVGSIPTAPTSLTLLVNEWGGYSYLGNGYICHRKMKPELEDNRWDIKDGSNPSFSTTIKVKPPLSGPNERTEELVAS
jgi:hypothetical protein